MDVEAEGDGTELKSLKAWGISSINLAYDDGTDLQTLARYDDYNNGKLDANDAI